MLAASRREPSTAIAGNLGRLGSSIYRTRCKLRTVRDGIRLA